MVKKAKTEEENDIEALDLVSLLATPENLDSFDIELSVPEQEIDLLALGAEALKEPEPAIADDTVRITKKTSPVAVTQKPAIKPVNNYNAPLPEPVIPRQVVTIQPNPRPASSAKPVVIAPTVLSMPDVKDDSFEKIISEISVCEKCGLCKTRTKTVPGVGNTKARLVFIGEAPGADEDTSGIPFVGKAGQHLDKIFKAAGFNREELYICNILKCRPPNNRNPELNEMRVCTPFLQRQLALIKPDIIACLGNVAIQYVIGPKTPGISRIHGQWFNSIFGIPTMAMYHPSYLVRSESRAVNSPNWQMWQDIKALKVKYDSLKK